MKDLWKKTNSIKGPYCNETYFPLIDLNLPQYHLGPDLNDHQLTASIDTNWESLDEEATIIKPTNSYTPPRILSAYETKSKALLAAKSCRDLSFTVMEELEEFILDDHADVIRADYYDSKNANVLEVTKLNGKNILLLPMGESQRELYLLATDTAQVVLSNPNKRSKTKYGFPSGNIHSILQMNFPSRIRQIKVSNALNIRRDKTRLIIGVRTDINVSLVLIEPSQSHPEKFRGRVLHEYFPMHQDQSRQCTPSDIALSPYDCYEYSFVGDNGYFASFNITCQSSELPTHRTVEYNKNLEETTIQSKRWRKCGYSCEPELFIIATPRNIMLLDAQGEMRKLYKTYDKSVRLYAFGVDKTPYSFFCVAVSLEDIILLDVRYTGKVMAQWKHNMDDAPPTHVEIITANGKTHIFAWDLLSHRVFTISFDYNGSLASGPGIYPMAKKISLATSQSIIFQKQEFKYLGGKSFIHMAGVATVLRSMPCSVLGSRPICAFFRLMKDGRLTYQLSLMSPWESAVPDATGLPCFITNDSLIKFMSSKIEKERIEERAKDTKKDDQVSMAKCILNESLSKILKPHTPERRITSNQIEGVLEDEKRISYPSTLAELIYRQGSGQPNRQQFIELYSSLQDNSETQTHWIPSSKEGGPIPFAGGDFLEDVLDGIDKNDVPPTISHLDQTCYATRVSTRQVLNTGLAETIAGNRIISIPVNRDTLATTPTLRFLALGNPLTNVTNSVKLLASEWTPGLSKSAHITVRNQYSRDQAKVVKPSDIFPIPVRAEKRKRGVDFEDIDAGFMFEESTQIIEVLGTSKNKKPIMSLTQPSSTTETMVSKLPATSSQPIPGAFSERKISAPKKKKKKVQGFK